MAAAGRWLERNFGKNFPTSRHVIDRTLEDIPDKLNRFVGAGLHKFSNADTLNFFEKAPKKPMAYKSTRRGRTAVRGRKTTKKKSYKRKAAPKRKIRKSTKKRKVGKSKSVKLTTGTARERIFDHSTPTPRVNCMYTSFSSVGSKDKMLRMVAQATLLHYMHRVGDYRANTLVVPVGDTDAGTDSNPILSTWGSMVFKFTHPGRKTTNQSDTVTVVGSTQTLEQMTVALAAALLAQAQVGQRLAQVSVFRDPSNGSDQCVLNDINAGRNIIEFSALAQMKLQNTMLADSTATGEDSGDRCSALNIHRNPLDGLVYKFKNGVPKFKQGYFLSKTALQQTALRNLMWQYQTPLSGVYEVDLGQHGPEFVAPPPSPTTIFSNSAGKTSCAINPGAHKTFSMKEFYSGPINSFLDRYYPTTHVNDNLIGDLIPPGGSCMMVGLKPKYRTSTSESIKLEVEHTYTYQARMTKAKITAIPMASSII